MCRAVMITSVPTPLLDPSRLSVSQKPLISMTCSSDDMFIKSGGTSWYETRQMVRRRGRLQVDDMTPSFPFDVHNKIHNLPYV